MKRLLVILIGVLAGISLIGCGTAREIKIKSNSEETSVFTEARDGDPIPKGLVELTIKASIKTHIEGYYIAESKKNLHGKEKYPFLVNIDAQAVTSEVEGIKEIKPAYDEDGKTSRDPEAGEGLRYVLEKKIILTPGAHKVFFGLPSDNYAINVEISLNEGVVNILEFKPVYRTKDIPTKITTFLKGINKYTAFLNGRQLP